ncbi:MAG TPA: Ig-like domain-containing protein, partial [Planctomycetaceae bacterium]
GTFVRLLRLDRATGQATPIGPGIQTFPGSTQGPTNLYALTYDPASQRLIALDYADGEVYAWDREGNGTLLTTSPNVRTWALSGGLSWGSFIVQPHGTGNGYLAGFDPATGMLLQPTLTLSEAAAFESLERNYDAFRYVVRVDGVTAGADFGMYDANWSPSAHPGGPYTIAEGQSLTLDGSRSSDEDDDPLTYEWDLKGDGTVDATGVNPTLTWQQLLAAGVTGEGVYTLRLRARDPGGSSSITTTTLTVTNAAPVAAADAYETDYGTTLTVAAAAGVLANDSDAGGDPLTAVLVSGPARGTLTLNADGSFTYTPNAAFVGTDTFTYAASDGTDQSGPTTVTITVGGPASAVVDLLTDEDDGNYAAGDLSLREAAKIVDAGGTITFASALAGGTITLTLGQISLGRDVTIAGLGATQLTISGNSASRHFFVAAGATVGLSGVTLTGGRVFPSGILGMGGAIDNRGALTLTDAIVTGNAADDFGGAIENFGTLTVVGCAFTNNSAGNTGGAIHNRGTLNVSRSAFTGNSATWGGAIRNDTYNNGGGFLTVADSTIADNTASWGGGIYATNQTTTLVGVVISGNSASEAAGGIDSGGTLTLVNVTISGNSTGGDGGGLRAGGSTTLRNVTIFGNRAGLKGDPSYSGGGIRKEGGTLTLHNTLIAGNLLGTGAGTANDVRGWGNAATGTNNFIADAASTAVPTNGVNGNIVGADWTTVVDPTLRDNGGPTLTHALLRGGRAVNAGNDAQALDPQGTPLATDQRGTG